MDYQGVANLATMFLDQAGRHAARPFLWTKRDKVWGSRNWAETDRQVRALSRGLRAAGVKPGDRVLLCAENRPEWLVADVAIMAAGAITVPVYVTNTADDHRFVLEDSGASAAIVSTAKLARALLPAVAAVPACRLVVAMERPEPAPDGLDLADWQAVLAAGEGLADDVGEVAGRVGRRDTACFIYTSGTGGRPKGVVLSHGAILANCAGAYDLLLDLGLDDEVFLSFLPLSHSYEHTCGQFFPISIGAQIYYAEGADALAANLQETRPTIVTAVPRLYEVLHGRINAGVRTAPALRRALFQRTLDLGLKRLRGQPLGLAGLLDPLLERLVRAKVRQRFGGRLKAFVSGGAPLNPDIGEFFLALGVPILQGYGQTEAAPVISCNRPRRVRIETVGPPLKGVEVRLAEDGEILVRGELLMEGYWNQPEASAAALQGGWLHTGDIGAIDADGYIRITDRKKDMIVLSGGDNIAPAKLEGALSLEAEIGQAMVVGDKRPFLVALIVPDRAWTEAWAAAAGKPADLALLSTDKAFVAALGQVVDRVNARLSAIEKIRRFAVLPSAFTTENGMMTPTLKTRRHVVRQHYQTVIDGLYEGRG
ncbi:MAG: AMP-dependent synthetase/ligase [Thalassobaculales bacterium]